MAHEHRDTSPCGRSGPSKMPASSALSAVPASQVSRRAPLPRRDPPLSPPASAGLMPNIAVALKAPLVVVQAFASPSAQLTGCTAIAGCAVWLLGDRGAALMVVMSCALLMDVLTGSLRALADGTFTGRQFYAGVARKLVRSQLVALGALMDWTFHIAIGLLWQNISAAVLHYHPLTLLALVSLIGYEVSGGLEHVRATWPNMPVLFAKISGRMAAGDVRGAAQLAAETVTTGATPSDAPRP